MPKAYNYVYASAWEMFLRISIFMRWGLHLWRIIIIELLVRFACWNIRKSVSFALTRLFFYESRHPSQHAQCVNRGGDGRVGPQRRWIITALFFLSSGVWIFFEARRVYWQCNDRWFGQSEYALSSLIITDTDYELLSHSPTDDALQSFSIKFL